MGSKAEGESRGTHALTHLVIRRQGQGFGPDWTMLKPSIHNKVSGPLGAHEGYVHGVRRRGDEIAEIQEAYGRDMKLGGANN